jgi:hypothetical protein
MRIRIKQSDPDPYQTEKQDPDPYQKEKQEQDPDPDPYQNGLGSQHCLKIPNTVLSANLIQMPKKC